MMLEVVRSPALVLMACPSMGWGLPEPEAFACLLLQASYLARFPRSAAPRATRTSRAKANDWPVHVRSALQRVTASLFDGTPQSAYPITTPREVTKRSSPKQSPRAAETKTFSFYSLGEDEVKRRKCSAWRVTRPM